MAYERSGVPAETSGVFRYVARMSVPLSVVVPSVKAWPAPAKAMEALAQQARDIGAEVILVSGHPEGLPASLEPPAVGLAVPGGDVFALRSRALVAARGEIVALLEDHCFAPQDWCTRLLQAWADHPEADGLIGSVENGAPALLDRASFLLTWAPFLHPLGQVPGDRCPPPGVVSYRRRVLPASAPPSGWLEYELPVRLRDEGRLVADDRVTIVHTQHLGLRAFGLQYHAGRGFTGLHDHPAARRSRRERLAYAAKMPRTLMRQTRTSLKARPGWKETPLALAAVGAFAACNAAGQVVGILRGDAGSSLGHLE